MKLLPLLLFLLHSYAKAQTITGRVVDENGRPLSAATVALGEVKSNVITKYTLTDISGRFSLSSSLPDSVRIVVSFAAYVTKDTVLVMHAETVVALPPWQLLPAAKNLIEVKVAVSKPLFDVQPDKTVFNVSQSITGGGGNAMELLRKSPNVLVDPNDAISMNGKTGVRIYLDGRPSPLSIQELVALLRTIPATDVEAIEIITNPSAKYEAAGNAGIINIIFKKNKSLGANGVVNAGWSVGIFPKYSGSISLNYRNKKLNLFGGYSYNSSQNQGYLNLFRFQSDSLFDQRSSTRSNISGHNIKAGADWFLNRKQTLGVVMNINSSAWTSTTVSRTPIASQQTKEVIKTLSAVTVSDRQRANVSVNANYRFADTLGRALNIDADFSHFDLDGQSATDNSQMNTSNAGSLRFGFSNHTPLQINFYGLQASWEQNWKKGKLSAGWRSTQATTENTFSFFNKVNGSDVLDANVSNQFSFTETIHAAYAQYNGQLKRWSYQAGLRAEHTTSLGELTALSRVADQTVRRNYLNLFPSMGFSYQAGTNHRWGLSYSRRIDRPSYQDLNPFENRLDALTYQKGNPFLRPQFTGNIEIKHTYKYKLNTSLGLSNVHDFFAAITDTINGNQNFITPRNIARQRIVSVNSSLPFTLFKWWSGFASVSISHNRYRSVFAPGKEIRINNTVANLYQQHTLLLSKRWTAEVSAFYLSPYVWAGNYECRSIWNIDAGIQHKVLKDQGTLKLSVTDIFQRLPWSGTSRLGSFVIIGSGGWESRQFRINFLYRFGNKEVKAARQRNSGVDDLNRRVQ